MTKITTKLMVNGSSIIFFFCFLFRFFLFCHFEQMRISTNKLYFILSKLLISFRVQHLIVVSELCICVCVCHSCTFIRFCWNVCAWLLCQVQFYMMGNSNKTEYYLRWYGEWWWIRNICKIKGTFCNNKHKVVSARVCLAERERETEREKEWSDSCTSEQEIEKL